MQNFLTRKCANDLEKHGKVQHVSDLSVLLIDNIKRKRKEKSVVFLYENSQP